MQIVSLHTYAIPLKPRNYMHALLFLYSFFSIIPSLSLSWDLEMYKSKATLVLKYISRAEKGTMPSD